MDFGPFSASKIAEALIATYNKESPLMESKWYWRKQSYKVAYAIKLKIVLPFAPSKKSGTNKDDRYR